LLAFYEAFLRVHNIEASERGIRRNTGRTKRGREGYHRGRKLAKLDGELSDRFL
jgi:hypothetical protein